jgi:hypothetical protein
MNCCFHIVRRSGAPDTIGRALVRLAERGFEAEAAAKAEGEPRRKDLFRTIFASDAIAEDPVR